MKYATLEKYKEKLIASIAALDEGTIGHLANRLFMAWESGNKVFLIGNGGSAANASHIANDFLYGIAPQGQGLDVEALTANMAVLTCLSNDIDYEHVFSHQLKVKGRRGDVLLAFTGSGNSPNIIAALKQAKKMQVDSVAIVGFDGGATKTLADYVIHVQVDDMQISEDMQSIVGHVLMKSLYIRIQQSGWNEKYLCHWQ